MTSDSMSARPRIIGVKILLDACGLREMPSTAEPAARPWPMPPPRAERPIASAAPRPSHLSRSARVASIACANAGFAVRKTATAVPKVAREANNLDVRRIGRLLVGFGFELVGKLAA